MAKFAVIISVPSETTTIFDCPSKIAFTANSLVSNSSFTSSSFLFSLLIIKLILYPIPDTNNIIEKIRANFIIRYLNFLLDIVFFNFINSKSF